MCAKVCVVSGVGVPTLCRRGLFYIVLCVCVCVRLRHLLFTGYGCVCSHLNIFVSVCSDLYRG